MPLSVLDRNEGCSLNRSEVPWGSFVLSVQDLCDGVTLRGRVCGSAYVLDRIVGFPEPLFSSSFAMRSLLWVESAYLCPYSMGTKVLTWLVLGLKFLRDGVTLLGRVSVPLYVLNRNEGFNLGFFGFSSSFAMRSPFLGSSICIHTSLIGSKELLVAGCCTLALLVACHLTVDCLLASSAATF